MSVESPDMNLASGTHDGRGGAARPASASGGLGRYVVCGVLIVCGILMELIGYLLQLWVLHRLHTLTEQYGWHHVPRAAIPNGALIDAATHLLVLSGFTLSLSAFFVAMARARRIGKERGNAEYSYGYGWTVGSIFIPLWSLYRPWVGLAEIRNSITAPHPPSGIGALRRHTPDSAATWTLAAIFIISGPISFMLAMATRAPVPHDPSGADAWLDSEFSAFAALAVVTVIHYGAMLVYLLTLYGPLQKLAGAAPPQAPVMPS